MLGKNTIFVIVFLIFLFSSPWFLILIQNYSILSLNKEDLLFSHNQVYIDEINVLRGQTIKADNPVLGKLFVNKFTIYGQEMTKKYLESFDPNYLFFSGGIDRVTSTGDSGQLPLSLLPLILYSIYTIYFSKNKYRNLILFIFVFSPIFSIIFYRHYEWIPKILFFISATLLATYGLVKIPKTKNVLIVMFLVFWIYETTNFYHKFKNHFTQKLAEQMYNIKK